MTGLLELGAFVALGATLILLNAAVVRYELRRAREIEGKSHSRRRNDTQPTQRQEEGNP